MNDDLFKTMLNYLTPKTVAYMVRDLQAGQEDWNYYPEEAPSETVKQELVQTLQLLTDFGTKLAALEGLSFQQILQQALLEQQQEEWAWQRDLQEQQNWTNDLE